MLDKAGIVYTKVDVTKDDAALAYVTGDKVDGGLGYRSAPVVYVSTIDGDIDWHGFRPDNIKKFITEIADAA
ncbi:glutaredoxin family protein [Arthrobacter cryoconiti]|nr:glutaredoxin family protein [Arthrobacter cryoconiti]